MRAWRADLADSAFVKITAVYGQSDKNGVLVRKRPARKMAITDKTIKNRCLSVRFYAFRTKFYGQTFQKAGFVRKSS